MTSSMHQPCRHLVCMLKLWACLQLRQMESRAWCIGLALNWTLCSSWQMREASSTI